MITGFVIAIIYGLIPYLGFHLNLASDKNEIIKKSIFAGLIVTALFFVFLKELFHTTSQLEYGMFLVALSGFTFLFFTRTSTVYNEKASRLITHLNGFVRIFHHGFMGVLIANIPGGEFEVLLFGLPILIAKFAGTYERIKARDHFKIPTNYEYISDFFVVIMYVVASKLLISEFMFALALSVIVGVLFRDILEMLYTNKEVIPSKMLLGTILFSIYFLVLELL